MASIRFNLNGKATSASYEPGMHLLEVLREQCGTMSAKDGCAPEGTDRMPEIVRQILEPRDVSYVPHILGRSIDAAEREPRRAARGVRLHAVPDVLRRFHVDMEGELRRHLAFRGASPNECAQASAPAGHAVPDVGYAASHVRTRRV